MELPESGVEGEARSHRGEGVFEWEGEGGPELFGDVAEGARAGADLGVEERAAGGAAAVSVKEEVAGVLVENGAVKI